MNAASALASRGLGTWRRAKFALGRADRDHQEGTDRSNRGGDACSCRQHECVAYPTSFKHASERQGHHEHCQDEESLGKR